MGGTDGWGQSEGWRSGEGFGWRGTLRFASPEPLNMPVLRVTRKLYLPRDIDTSRSADDAAGGGRAGALDGAGGGEITQ